MANTMHFSPTIQNSFQFNAHFISNALSNSVQFLSRWFIKVAIIILKTEAITGNSRIDVKMKMEHFLHGRFTIRDKHIDPITFNI